MSTPMPGPWRADTYQRADGSVRIRVVDANGHHVCECETREQQAAIVESRNSASPMAEIERLEAINQQMVQDYREELRQTIKHHRNECSVCQQALYEAREWLEQNGINPWTGKPKETA